MVRGRDTKMAKRSARWMVLKAFAPSWESTTVLSGSERRAALMAWPMLSAQPGVPTPSCSGARDGPASGSSLMQTMAAKHSHALQMAMGRSPRLLGFSKATPLLFKRASTRGIVNASMAFTKARQVRRPAGQPKIAACSIVRAVALARSFAPFQAARILS
jgi:hypothetical protein